jgi:hypothetical protein
MCAPLEQYLARYAEPEVQLLGGLPSAFQFQHCVVIPARDESFDFIQRLLKISSQIEHTILAIVVINQPLSPFETNQPALDQHEVDSSDQNLQLANTIADVFGDAQWSNGNLALFQQQQLSVLRVDRFSQHPIPPKQGVGLARKIGCDLACKLNQTRQLASSWIYSSDADAFLPDNYFALPTNIAPTTSTSSNEKILAKSDRTQQYSAQVFEFEHIAVSETTLGCLQATQLYQRAIKYYRDGLAWAGSPYGFYTLGSTLAVNISSYAKVRGFPKRAGAEDFYLLNKLAKIAPVYFNRNIQVNIAARQSQRVPFGTGPAIASIMQLTNPELDYCYYHPQLFILLKQWLSLISQFWQFIQLDSCKAKTEQKKFNDLYADLLGSLPVALAEIAANLDLSKFLQHASRQCRSEPAFREQFHQWFDGFLTLKFIRGLEPKFTPIPLPQAEQLLHEYICSHTPNGSMP